MQIKTKILAVLRVMNTIVDNLEDREYMDLESVFGSLNVEVPTGFTADSREDFKSYDKQMPDDYLVNLLGRAGIHQEDYGTIANILKSMALMTKAHVGTIRNPEGFNPDMSHTWPDYFKESEHFLVLAMHLGIDLTSSPKKEDYVLAQKMIRTLGSSILNEEEVQKMFEDLGIEKEFGMPQKVAKEKHLQIPKILYRGLKDLSLRAYKKVTTVGYIWGIGNAVSTSAMFEISENFANDSYHGYGIVFVINNPNRQGFVADKLSGFDEQEIILSGELKVTGFEKADFGKPYATIYVDLI